MNDDLITYTHDDAPELEAASDEDLELALRLVAWNARDLGQFLRNRRAMPAGLEG